MPTRVHESQPLASGTEIVLGECNQQHLVRVLRLREGDEFILFNGDGHEYEAVLVEAGKRTARARLGRQSTPCRESPLRTHLGLVLSKGDRLDYAIQKSAELGVSEISLLGSTRCEVRLDAERLERKREHLQQVAVAACEQSGRVCVPVVNAPILLTRWVGSVDARLKLLMHPGEAGPGLPSNCSDVAVLVGPEGGLTPAEIEAALTAGFELFVLGPRVLRTETAPAAALTWLQQNYGDFPRPVKQE